MIGSTSTLRSIALEHPPTIRVFEDFHLDYCCGGNRPLAEVCAEKGIAVETVLTALAEVDGNQAGEHDLAQATLTELIEHIVETHHAYIRNELPRLEAMAGQVAAKHGKAHPETVVIASQLRQLGEELLFHLNKEERILFPYIAGLERSRSENAAAPGACFASVEHPIQAMMHEHAEAGALMEEMRTASGDYTPPADACPTFVGLYHGLDAFEQDLHRHVHLENNLLFPGAMELEKELLAVR